MKYLLTFGLITQNLSKLYTVFIISGILFSLLSLSSCLKDELTEDEIRIDIQNRLDSGESPLEIYNSYKNLDEDHPDYYIVYMVENLSGFSYGGGIIIHFNPDDGTGIVASEEDLMRTSWGCDSTVIQDLPEVYFTFFNDPGARIGDGISNTIKIIASDCGINSAAKACADYVHNGYDDWFLPAVATAGSMVHAGAQGEYWSSTATRDSTTAWATYVGSPNHCREAEFIFGLTTTICSFNKPRNQIKKVRAVRKF